MSGAICETCGLLPGPGCPGGSACLRRAVKLPPGELKTNRVPRNMRCFCGSGKKFKACCGLHEGYRFRQNPGAAKCPS